MANRRPIGPYSKPHVLAKLDGRRREAKLIQAERAALVAHVGGYPNAVQWRLIRRAEALALRMAVMDAKSPDGVFSEKDTREYLCWNNAYVRTLRELGFEPAPVKPPTLAEILATPGNVSDETSDTIEHQQRPRRGQVFGPLGRHDTHDTTRHQEAAESLVSPGVTGVNGAKPRGKAA